MCIRNDQGRFVKAKTMWFDGNPPPKEAEACALKEGISWLGELEFSKVVIELDCMLVVNAIKNNSNNRT
jgi:ribonuclease HI